VVPAAVGQAVRVVGQVAQVVDKSSGVDRVADRVLAAR